MCVYFSKLHRKLAQIFSAFFGFWPDSSPEGGNKSRLQAGRNRVLAPESIAYEFQIFSELDFGAILGLILNSSRVFACAGPHRVRNRNIDPKSRPRT